MTGLVVLDTTVLSNFGKVGRDDLIARLWGDGACTTEAALCEYQAGVSLGVHPLGVWANLRVEVLTEEELAFAHRLHRRLGPGERSCIAVALHRGMAFASDDGAARRAASNYKIPVVGTLGILAACVEQEHLPREEGNELLARMIALGFRSLLPNLDPLLD